MRPGISIACLLAAAIAGCGGGSDDDAASQPPAFRLKVVNLLPLSGELAPLGQSGRKAAALAAADVRSAIEKVGANQSLELVDVDYAGEAKLAVERTRAELAKGAISCITGPWTTAPALDVLNQVAIPEGIVEISPAATAEELTSADDHGLLERTVLPDAAQGPALADAIEQDLGGAGGRRIAVAFEDNLYGKRLAATFGAAWRDKDGIVDGPVSFPANAGSYDAVAKRIAAEDVDGFAIFGFASAYQKLAAALVRAGRWDADRTYGADALAARELPTVAGAEATEGLRGTAPGVPEGSPATEAFDRRFDRAGGPKRQTFAAQLFDAVVLCYAAAVEADGPKGTAIAPAMRKVSGPPGEKFTWQQLPQMVRALAQGKDVDYQGASGPIDLDAAGDATRGAYDLFRFRNGRLELYDQVAVGDASD